MTDEEAVTDALLPMLGTYVSPDSELVSKLCGLFRAWRHSPSSIPELTNVVEDILFRFCYNALGAGMRVPNADGSYRRIMLSDLNEKADELITLPLCSLPATRTNYQMLYSVYMDTASSACLRALAKNFADFFSEAEYRYILSILQENDPKFASSLPGHTQSQTDN